MPDEDKNFCGSLVLDSRKWWRHVKTIYSPRMERMEMDWTLKKLASFFKFADDVFRKSPKINYK